MTIKKIKQPKAAKPKPARTKPARTKPVAKQIAPSDIDRDFLLGQCEPDHYEEIRQSIAEEIAGLYFEGSLLTQAEVIGIKEILAGTIDNPGAPC